MKNLLFVLVLFGLSGCLVPFDRYNKGIGFNGGMPYRVPYGSYFGTRFDTQELVDHFNKYGIHCKLGDIFWTQKDYFDENQMPLFDEKNKTNQLEQAKRNDIDNKIMKNDKFAYDNGLAGCQSPMSQQEFEYYSKQEGLNMQYQHEQNIQNQKSLDKALDRTTPKRYEHNLHIFNY